jgi:hypothetical protein
MSIWIYLTLYICIMAFVYGFIGGIRDEMDGLGDMAKMVFWPIWIGFHIIAFVIRLLNSLGRALKS